MSEIATASINTFGPSPKADSVAPSEEQIFVLTSGQLQEIITRAIQPLQDRIDSLEAIVASQEKKIATLDAEDTEAIGRLAEDIAYDRRRLARLEHPEREPGKTELARVEKIEKYLATRPDHKATFETLKGYLGVGNDLLNKTIKSLMKATPGRYGITRAPGDKRKRTLVMLPK